jgi:hypothetical protein
VCTIGRTLYLRPQGGLLRQGRRHWRDDEQLRVTDRQYRAFG